MTRKLRKTSGLFKETIYRHHIEPRVPSYVSKEESFPVSLKYIDVIRSTQTDLDEAQEKRIEDHWNVDGGRNLSDSWTGFTRFTLLNELLQKDFCGPGWDWQNSKRHHLQITYGMTLGQELKKPLREKKNKNGQSRNRNSNTPENWEEYILFIRVTKKTKISFRMQGESWRHQRQLQCHAEERFLKHA